MHNAGVFATGYLVGGEAYLYEEPSPAIVGARDGWTALAAKHGCSLPAVALRFASVPKVVERVLLGVKSPEEVRLNAETIKEAAAVPAAIWADAKAAGLLPQDLPVPEGGGAKL